MTCKFKSMPAASVQPRVPDELKETELKLVVRPVRKKKERFAGLFMDPVRVSRISIPSRDEIHER
jgi:hypothetical protein